MTVTREQWEQAINSDLYSTLADKSMDILDLLFDQDITPKKAAEAIAERALGFEPDLPESTS